ncbi:hypothetical protein GCM10027299_26830 [Larkinella ripae]
MSTLPDLAASDLVVENEQLRFALEAAGIGTWDYNLVTGLVQWSTICKQLFGLAPENDVSAAILLAQVHPDDRERVAKANALALNPANTQEHNVVFRTLNDTNALRWVQAKGRTIRNQQGQLTRFSGIVQEITQSILAQQTLSQSEARQAFLLLLSDRLRPLADPDEIQYQAACVLGDYLGANRVGFAEDRGDGETFAVTRNYINGVADIKGVYRYADYDSLLMKDFRAGQTVIRPDIAADSTLTDSEKEARRLLQLGAAVSKPLIKDGHLLAAWFIHYQNPHDFSAQELNLLEEVAERTWAALERARAETALRQSEERYRLFSSHLDEQVRQRTQQLEISVRDLKRSNENLQQFAYIASHDLQEPLRKIQSFSSILQQQFSAQLGEQGTDMLMRMASAGERMSILIRDLLMYSRISTRQQNFGDVSLNAIITKVLNTLDWAIGQRNAQIEVDSLPVVKGDESQLGQLFQNLLSNALKFTPENLPPRIKISCTEQLATDLPQTSRPAHSAKRYYQLSVQDQGIGFDPKYLDRIFQVFQRLHGKGEYPGTGVGLAICQRVAENHGGSITASSEPGNGATFRVFLPIVNG